jgi:uncharacterized protein (DUF952 family)
MENTVYKIVPAEIWQKAIERGIFEGAGIDIADGFIHLSTGAQAVRTAELYFAGQTGLVLVAVNAESLGAALVFEPSRDGALFPHLYGALPLDAVRWAKPLPVGPDGKHVFPELDA